MNRKDNPQKDRYYAARYEKMIQRIFYFFAVAFIIAFIFTSCASTRNGCPMPGASRSSYRG